MQLIFAFLSFILKTINSNNFFGESIRYSANKGSNFFFPIWVPYISFYSLIALTVTSSTMLNRSESAHPQLCTPMCKVYLFFPLWPLYFFLLLIGFEPLNYVVSRWFSSCYSHLGFVELLRCWGFIVLVNLEIFQPLSPQIILLSFPPCLLFCDPYDSSHLKLYNINALFHLVFESYFLSFSF